MTRTWKGERRERGFTLMELMVVIVLAGIVTLGLVVFYLNSQAMWMDASTQALAQRDATALIEAMRERAEGAAQALVLPVAAGNHLLILYDKDSVEMDRFFWSPTDSLVHHGEGDPSQDQGAVVPTIIERFHLSLDASLPPLPLVNLDTLRVHSTTGQKVQMSTTMALYNGAP